MSRAGLALLSAVLTAGLAVSPPAAAIDPPQIDASVAPPDGTPGPVTEMSQFGACGTSEVLPGTDPGAVTTSQQMLNLPDAWQFSRGAGQKVAIIDTGVRPGPRLPEVEAGGDYVESTDGLTDCDGQGTLVAGIVAGQPGDDGFSGVAPDSTLLAIRAASMRYSPRATDGADPMVAHATAAVAMMARAVVHAADLGARVITLSAPSCLPVDRPIDLTALGAALRYAAVEKDAVVVAAAGNNGASGAFGGGATCESNPGTDLNRTDSRNWEGVTALSLPSYWQPYVLSVGALTPTGQPSKLTMSGPWVGIAAPGENVVSVSNRDDGGLANAMPGNKQQLVPLNSTSYAAGYVAGVAALVRSRFPEMNANQVVQRITATAHNGARAPSNLVGAGTLDPVAALTWDLPAAADPAPTKSLPAPPEPEPTDPTPRIVAYTGSAVLLLGVVVVAALVARRRKETSE
ncbi:type VII secretion-associated serine protease mycosin [Mycobacterium koreense]|uniref:Type VII secretion-associated serine protease mycosin n=1 Tax=Mycolicibacillus koreensis TaxID=1069220 RepID=A0AA91PBR2_9MYCO|nr:type VII secretion-associated serine protease mycosin [Mycolicibacillus koreensis]MCV7248582.1 type VII secretion-associated serine protease mycosin [Mycolicibacillus koreensis]ODR11828.1 type VII secretion-associated serine protease mycosin [Mycolicibacillus koreensis]OSC29399.1 type VII secretion-associated serine protease mycosin [Mycolicibacillus koreensis]